MNIMELGAIGELVGGVAVLVTLIYLVVQVRQRNSNARASARQTLLETWSQTQFDLGHHPELLRILGEGFADYGALSDNAKIQFDFVMSRYVSNVHNGVLLHREGMLDQATLDQIGGMLSTTAASPGGVVWWERWPQPTEVEEYLGDYRRRHPHITPMHELFPHWVPSGIPGS